MIPDGTHGYNQKVNTIGVGNPVRVREVFPGVSTVFELNLKNFIALLLFLYDIQ